MLLASLTLTFRLLYCLTLWPKFLSARNLPGPTNHNFLTLPVQKLLSRALQTVPVRTILNSKMLRYLGVSGIGWILPTTLEALKGLPHTKDYGFIKSNLVASDISNILGNEGLLFVGGTGHKVERGLLLPAFFTFSY